MSQQEISKSRYKLILLALALSLLAIAFLSLMIGPLGFFLDSIAIARFRLSRVMLAIIAGSSLAASGASLQAIFKNPLADPHLFGISGGAALGACIAIAFCSKNHVILPSAGAMIGGLLAFLALYFYLRRSNRMLNNCLLVGVLINSLAASLITMLKVALPAHKSQSLLFWLVGHVGVVAGRDFFLIIPLWLLGMGCLWSIKGQLEILSFGFDEGRLLGLDPVKVTKIAIIANCILVGNVVSWAGMISFIGLIIPHLIRVVYSANLRIMLPLASIVGAIVLLLFDTLSRGSFMIWGSEIPVGALCALFLSPPFFLLLLKSEEDAHNH